LAAEDADAAAYLHQLFDGWCPEASGDSFGTDELLGFIADDEVTVVAVVAVVVVMVGTLGVPPVLLACRSWSDAETELLARTS
jgi:hypothetical protein